MTKKHNLKRIIKQLDKKKDFVEQVADYYSVSATYINQKWFSAEWNIPERKIDTIIDMAQRMLHHQINIKSRMLKNL